MKFLAPTPEDLAEYVVWLLILIVILVIAGVIEV